VILSEEEIQEERDDGAPIEVLEQYFEARGWACERTAEGEIVASATGSWAQYELRGVWRPEDQVLQFLAFPDIKVGPDKRNAIFEALSLINEQLWLGHFDVWLQEGLIMFRQGLMLNGALATTGQCEALLKAALEACERYYQAFQFVVWAGKESRDALTSTMFETEGRA
jgi:hypothetical protein